MKLMEISAFLLEMNLFAAEDFDSWVEDPQFIITAKDLGSGGMQLARHDYKGVLYIERYAHKRHKPDLLYAQIAAWLLNNDCNRPDNQSAEITIDVTVLDASTAEVIITIGFSEAIEIKEAAHGDIDMLGKRWQLADAKVYTAKQGEVVDV